MKRITRLVFVAFGCVLMLMSCSKSDDAVPNTPPIQISGLINGGSWTGTLGGAVIAYDTAHSTEKLYIGGTSYIDTAIENISIAVDSFNGIGTYKITKTGAAQAYYWLHAKYYAASSGSITVQSYSTKQVKGYYNFKTDSVNITEGSFNLHVQ